jgi:hypothetical protein
MGLTIVLIGLVADIIGSVRRLLEEVLYRQRRLEDRLSPRESAKESGTETGKPSVHEPAARKSG